MNKDGFTLVELMIIVAIIGLLISIFLPAFNHKKPPEELKGIPSLYNDKLLEYYRVKKLFELNGQDVYVFWKDGHYHSVVIPSTNSVYTLERK